MKRGRGGRTPRGGRGQGPDPVIPDVNTPPLAPSSAMSIDPRSGQPQRASQASEATDGRSSPRSSPTERVVANKADPRRSRRLAGKTPTDAPNTTTTSQPQVTQSGKQTGLAGSDSPESSNSDPPEGEICSSPPEGEIGSSPHIPADDDPHSEEEAPEMDVENTDAAMHPTLSVEEITNNPEPDIQYVVTFDRQPPQEIRTDTEMPTFIVSLQILENGVPGRPQFCGESSENFNAVATLITTDGQTPTTFLGNETIMPPTPAPGVEQSSAEGVRWLFHFAPGVITASGYFQMHIAVVITRVSPPSDDEGDYMIIDSPIATLHIKSRVFHVHPFAVRRVSPTSG